MHLLVLSAFRRDRLVASRSPLLVRVSQCTFWCSVFSDIPDPRDLADFQVSMHLLVLSAFRRPGGGFYASAGDVSMHLLVLSAFRRIILRLPRLTHRVSMHLLVLSAFRQ